MKEKLLNNLGLKIISLILAFIVWMAIVNISNPTVTDDQDVPLEIRNEDALEANDLTYEIIGKSTINVKYDVRTRDQSLIRASDFHAYIDLKDYNVTEAIPVTVEISKEKEQLIVDRDSITAKPMVVRIKTEALQRKEFKLKVTSGVPEDGYALGTVTLTPESVWVRGPESEIGKINSMGVELSDVEGASADVTGKVSPVFYDANDKQLSLSEKVKIEDVEEITYTASILKAKKLNLNFEVQGQVAAGYRFTGVECAVKQVPVVGTKSVLASVSTLSIADDKLDITGATHDKTVTLDVNDYLPPSTTLAGEVGSALEVTLKVEPLTTRVFTLTTAELEKKGTVAGYEYGLSVEKADVTVRGLKEDLDTLGSGDLNAVLDVENLTPGTYPATLQFDIGEGFEIVGYSNFEVTVISEEDEETDTESDGTKEVVSSSAEGTSEAAVHKESESEQ